MGRERTARPGPAGPEAQALAVPGPYEPLTATSNLIEREREDLEKCEAAIDALRIAFWSAGKALDTIRTARLYRSKYETFDGYLEDRWQMTRQQASRLILAWQLAEKLAPHGKRLNERQVRVLLPVAAVHGDEAAETVYLATHQAAVEVDGVSVTADVLAGAARPFVGGTFDRGEAEQRIRAYIAQLSEGTLPEDDPGAGTPLDRWDADADRARKTVRKTLDPETLRAIARDRPDKVRQLVAEIEDRWQIARGVLAEVEKETAS